jgi:hypothetical protein
MNWQIGIPPGNYLCKDCLYGYWRDVVEMRHFWCSKSRTRYITDDIPACNLFELELPIRSKRDKFK